MNHERRMRILRFVICVFVIFVIMAYIAPNAR